jgi:hypothetical protein
MSMKVALNSRRKLSSTRGPTRAAALILESSPRPDLPILPIRTRLIYLG